MHEQFHRIFTSKNPVDQLTPPCSPTCDPAARPAAAPPFAPATLVSEEATSETVHTPFPAVIELEFGQRAALCSSQAWRATVCTAQD